MRIVKVPTAWRTEVFCAEGHRMTFLKGHTPYLKCPQCGEEIDYDEFQELKTRRT